MDDKTKLADATSSSDLSGLKLDNKKHYTTHDIYLAEAKNILSATLKCLGAKTIQDLAPFDYDFLLKMHKDMFGGVWSWAGEIRKVELNFGVRAYQVSSELKKLVDDLNYWHTHNTFDTIEISARLHHRAVVIHPFLNGNGRWSRMLANIYLKQNGLSPTKWNENQLAKENTNRDEYIKALKKADGGNYAILIKLQGNLV